MKKTFSINISGVGFVIDEDAYEMLGEYLDTLRHAFSRTDGAEDLLQDMELRIAELLCERPGGQNAIVSLEDIEKVIAQMGRPEEMDVEIEATDPATDEAEEVKVEMQEPPAYTPRAKRRLFRDPENKMLGGVCAGIAAYLDVDVTWVRLAVVAITILSMSVGAIGYLVLWIVVPEAVTPTQRLQMRGEAPTLENIARAMRAAGNSVVEGTRHGFADSVASFAAILAKIAIVFFLVIAAPVLIALIIGVVGCICVLIAFATCSLMGLAHPEWFGIGDFNETAVLWGVLCAIGYMLTLGVPVALLVHKALKSWRKRRPLSKQARRFCLIAWIIGLVLAGVSTGMLIAYDQMESKNRQSDTPSPEVVISHPEGVEIIEKSAEDSVILGLVPEAGADSLKQAKPAETKNVSPVKVKKSTVVTIDE